MQKQHLFAITKKDFTLQVFRSGGSGGQHQNKTSSGVRIIHNDSGARGESRNMKSQAQNKKIAFKRLTDTVKFKVWISKKVFANDTSMAELNRIIDNDMRDRNLLIESF